MVRALATAQVQSVREISKKADIKKTNKKMTIFVLAFFISLMVLYVGYMSYTYYVNSRFEFKESERGINFYSKEYGVKDALNTILGDSNILILANIKEKDSNNTEPVTESIVLFNTMLFSKQKNATTIINILDNSNNIVSCTTNKGDFYTNEELLGSDCYDIINSATSIISFDYPDENLKESAVYLNSAKKKLEIKSRTKNDLIISTYLILKSNYPDLEKTLSQVEAIKEKLGDINSSIPQLTDTNN